MLVDRQTGPDLFCMRIPSATYRLQFHAGFRFSDALALVPYLHSMGISDLYTSPLFQARKGSEHGYDVTHPNRLNPELGTAEEFDALVAALQERGMGLLLDIVPNHMAASAENDWWMDVLENGYGSPYAAYFSIEWQFQRPAAEEKIYLPKLGDPFGQVLESGQLRLSFDERGFFLQYWENRLPIDPSSYAMILQPLVARLEQELPEAAASLAPLREHLALLPARTATDWDMMDQRLREKDEGKARLWRWYEENPAVHGIWERVLADWNGRVGEPASFNALEELLQHQAYRLAYWKAAREKINYRRFFDVTDLVSLRAHDPQVFEATHAATLRMVDEGKVTGLRIDHVDGLYDTSSYLDRLQQTLREHASGQDFYIVVEKITLGPERLPAAWPVAGTTGYDFLAMVNSLFIEPAGFAALEQFYRTRAPELRSFADLTYSTRKQMMNDLFRGEMRALAQRLADLAEQDRHARDLSPRDLGQALRETTACMPVYRTYTNGFTVDQEDARRLVQALEEAQRRNPAIPEASFAYVQRVLLLQLPDNLTEPQRQEWLGFVMRWQRTTSPVMAKGVEDTAFYRFHALASLTEVGSDLQLTTRDEFHTFQQQRQQHWPHTLNATSTHDTKRSEDVRMRLNVLSELPDEWSRLILRWSRWNRDCRREINGQLVPDDNEEYLLYQTLVGAWPFHQDDLPAFRTRLHRFVEKAFREAKLHSSWLSPAGEYEQAVRDFLDAILNSARANPFLSQFQSFAGKIAFLGALNSLSQLILKATCPGVPDFYQGNGQWDLSLVDPDNRRPVNFAPLQANLHVPPEGTGTRAAWLAELWNSWQDGRIKQFVTRQVLCFRRQHPELFAQGAYIPLSAAGLRERHLVAYARHDRREAIVVVVPRFTAQLSPTLRPPLGGRVWRDTELAITPLPGPFAHVNWHNIFTGETVSAPGPLRLAELFRHLPFTLLYGVLPG